MCYVMDEVGKLLWYSMFLTPVVTIPIVWVRSKERKIIRVLYGLGLALVISLLLFVISFSILMRDGLGPV